MIGVSFISFQTCVVSSSIVSILTIFTVWTYASIQRSKFLSDVKSGQLDPLLDLMASVFSEAVFKGYVVSDIATRHRFFTHIGIFMESDYQVELNELNKMFDTLDKHLEIVSANMRKMCIENTSILQFCPLRFLRIISYKQLFSTLVQTCFYTSSRSQFINEGLRTFEDSKSNNAKIQWTIRQDIQILNLFEDFYYQRKRCIPVDVQILNDEKNVLINKENELRHILVREKLFYIGFAINQLILNGFEACKKCSIAFKVIKNNEKEWYKKMELNVPMDNIDTIGDSDKITLSLDEKLLLYSDSADLYEYFSDHIKIHQQINSLETENLVEQNTIFCFFIGQIEKLLTNRNYNAKPALIRYLVYFKKIREQIYHEADRKVAENMISSELNKEIKEHNNTNLKKKSIKSQSIKSAKQYLYTQLSLYILNKGKEFIVNTENYN